MDTNAQTLESETHLLSIAQVFCPPTGGYQF